MSKRITICDHDIWLLGVVLGTFRIQLENDIKSVSTGRVHRCIAKEEIDCLAFRLGIQDLYLTMTEKGVPSCPPK